MKTKIAINGFGRIGRLTFRELFKNPNFEIVAINDLTDAKSLAHLLKYDSAQGVMHEKISSTENSIIVDGKSYSTFAERDPSKLPWKYLCVDIVLESTVLFVEKEKAMVHITAGAKRVVISAPAKGDLKTIVYNVNHKTLSKSTEHAYHDSLLFV